MTQEIEVIPPQKTSPHKAKYPFGPDRREKFLRALSRMGTVTGAAEVAGISRRTIYHTAEKDAEFQMALDDAKEQHIDRLEQKAINRTDQSDRLLEYLLDRKRYRKHTNGNGGGQGRLVIIIE